MKVTVLGGDARTLIYRSSKTVTIIIIIISFFFIFLFYIYFFWHSKSATPLREKKLDFIHILNTYYKGEKEKKEKLPNTSSMKIYQIGCGIEPTLQEL